MRVKHPEEPFPQLPSPRLESVDPTWQTRPLERLAMENQVLRSLCGWAGVSLNAPTTQVKRVKRAASLQILVTASSNRMERAAD
jgi:hypothetical protein